MKIPRRDIMHSDIWALPELSKDKNSKNLQNFRGLEEAIIIRTLEGDGKDIPFREIIHVYNKPYLVKLGEIDPLTKKQ